MVRAGKAVVILHITFLANVLYAATIGLPASNSIVDEIAEDVAENVVFSLDVQAIDQDKSGNDALFYNVRYLHPDDSFILKTETNSTTGIYKITVPGR